MMKRTFAALAALLVMGSALAMGQPVAAKKFEFGTSVSLFSADPDNEGSSGLLNIPVRFGWFVWKGLEIEPEIMLSIPLNPEAGDETSYVVIGNLTYNFKTSGKLVPFVGGGAGVGNGFPTGGFVMRKGQTVTTFDGLLGVKYILNDYFGVRAEYRFNRFKIDVTDGTLEGTYHQFLIGFSLFF
jgi:hypothetical protein